MIKRKLMILAIFLVSLLVVSAVSAADNAAEDIASAEETTDEVVSVDENQAILSENNDVGTFGDLQREINDAPEGSVLNLTRDYNGAEDAVVWLNKDLTLDGQGHTIDCKGDDCSAFYSDAGTITLKNLKIINGYNDDNYKGGAIYIGDAAQYTIINCTFSNNWADDYGGAIYNGVNKLTIIDCTFTNNEADDYNGGAICSKGELEIKNSTFTSNTADDEGGAIYCEKYAHIKDCVFKSNSVDDCGGAIMDDESMQIADCIFEDNYADNIGGAIFCGKDLIVDSCSFNNNWADNAGGAICAYGSDQILTIGHSSFTNNGADDFHGGAIYTEKDAYITNSRFESNTAYNYGGAIYGKRSVNVDKCSFKSNKADGLLINLGGAISCGIGNIANSIFEDNYADNSGGAIYSNDLTLDGSTFKYNSADDQGGAIYAYDLTWVDSPSYFIGNTADEDGGAIYAERFKTDMKYGVFINNMLTSNDDGGAISIYLSTNMTFSQCYFENNRCGDEGGAIYLNDVFSHVTLKSNVFADNWAEDKGNIVYNCGHYDYIGYNWYGANSFDFSNELVEYIFGGSDISHTDEHMLNAVMYMDDNITLGKEAKLTIYFSNENTPADLFMMDATFSADNGAVLSDWHTFNGSAYVTGITLAKTGVTHITAQVHNQILKLNVTPSRVNLTLNASAEPINPGENATVIVTGLENATGDVFVVVNFTEWSGKIDNGVAKIIVSGLKESTTAVVTFYSDDYYNPAQTTVNITVNPQTKENLTIEAIAKPMTVGTNATVIVTGLKNATGNVTVTVNNKTYTAPIKDGESTVLIPGITENVTAIVKYAGDEMYNPVSTTVNITVNPAVDTKLQSKIYLRNALYFVTQTKMVKVTLWDANNRPIANKTVHITLNAHNLTYSGVTDENGDAYIRVGVGFGVHNATVSFDGDDQYNASERTGQIRVIKETPSIMVRGDNQKFKANDNPKIVKAYLWDRNSKPLPINSKVAIKLNGVTYIGYTDSNGIASIKINVYKPGTFNAQVIYAGNSAYNAVSRSVKFTIS